jgi:hypothetical protein
MGRYHVLAAIGEAAEDHRSLGVLEAGSAREALDSCLDELDGDPDLDGVPSQLAFRAHQEWVRLREQVHQPDAYFIVTPVEAEAHFVRDRQGEIRDAASVERHDSILRRTFGLDVL